MPAIAMSLEPYLASATNLSLGAEAVNDGKKSLPLQPALKLQMAPLTRESAFRVPFGKPGRSIWLREPGYAEP